MCRDQKEKDGKVWLLHARNYDRAYPEKTAAIMDISRREILDKLERVHTIDNKEISDIMEPCR